MRLVVEALGWLVLALVMVCVFASGIAAVVEAKWAAREATRAAGVGELEIRCNGEAKQVRVVPNSPVVWTPATESK